MASPTRPQPTTKSLPTLFQELRELVVAYAKQETIEPLRGLFRYVAWGVAGSLLLGIGVVLLLLAGLRALQEETGSRFTGDLTWVPYALTLVGTVVIAALAGTRIGRKEKSRR